MLPQKPNKFSEYLLIGGALALALWANKQLRKDKYNSGIIPQNYKDWVEAEAKRLLGNRYQPPTTSVQPSNMPTAGDYPTPGSSRPA